MVQWVVEVCGCVSESESGSVGRGGLIPSIIIHVSEVQ